MFFLPENNIKKSPKIIEKRDFSKRKIEDFKTILNGISWNDVINAPNVQTSYNLFSDTFLHLYYLHFPIKKVRFNKKYHNLEPWMTPGLLISRIQKFALSSVYSSNPTVLNKTNYNVYRNLYNRTVKTAKKLYFDREFKKHKSNLKKTWELLKFAINADNKNQIHLTEIFSDGIKYTDPQTIANKLNEFFINAPLKIVNEIPKCHTSPVQEIVHGNTFSLSNSPVTRTEIMDAIVQLQPKKSEDMFNLSMYTVKQFVASLIEPLYHIIFKSFETGEIPEQLKIAKVIPIFKTGDKTLPDNYRPISLLPNFSKIFEKVMANRLTTFLETNNLLCEEQFGFRKSHSTLHPLVHFLNNISDAKNKNKYSIAIFCDLKKAFDTVDHQILLKKLYNLGVRGIELEWFRNYLKNRKQFVFVNGKNSSLLSILIGVPQGSILGPLLFLIYINDLPTCNNLKNSLFADDTMLLDSHEDLPTLVSKINLEFHKIVNYFQYNKLALHKDKTKFLLFFKNRNSQTPELFFDFNPLSDEFQNPALKFPMTCVNDLEDQKIKFLGIFIDPFLTFKDHISHINSKISTGLYFIRSVRNILNEKSLRYLYFALVHSHLIYAIQIYSCTNENALKSIFIKQKNAIRIITNSKYNSHTEPLFKKSQILPFPKLCEFFKIQFMQRFIQNFLPSSFNNTWITNRIRRHDQAEIELRNDDALYIPFARNNAISRFPLTSFPKIWEEFPADNIKFIRNKLEFNSELKNHFLEQLNPTVVCTRLLCPSCHL